MVPVRHRAPKPCRHHPGDGSVILRSRESEDTRQTWQGLLRAGHGALGTVTEIAGLYILLAAGTKVLPHKFRLTEYKPWMRGLLVLWWLVLLLGLATYARWYVPDLFRK
jgi:hypothetical protein